MARSGPLPSPPLYGRPFEFRRRDFPARYGYFFFKCPLAYGTLLYCWAASFDDLLLLRVLLFAAYGFLLLFLSAALFEHSRLTCVGP